MKSTRNAPILATALAGALLGAAPAASAQDSPPATLELAQRTFKKLDANKDGKISLAEARRGGLTASSVNGEDADADQHLSEAEFTLLYRGLLSSRGYPIAKDLDRAVDGIQAARKQAAEAQRTEEARKKQSQQSAEARTTAARKKQAELDAQRTQDARKKEASGGDGADGPKPTQVPTKPKRVKKPRKPSDGTPSPAAGSKGRAGGSDGAHP